MLNGDAPAVTCPWVCATAGGAGGRLEIEDSLQLVQCQPGSLKPGARSPISLKRRHDQAQNRLHG